jgi:succinoglycan biosynthesis transport protein ExoP
MQYLSSGPNDDLNHNPSRENTLPDIIRQPYISVNPQAKEPSSFRVGPLLRKYWLLLLLLAIFGGAAGFVSVVLSSPMYQSHLIVELQNPNAGLSRDGAGASLEASDVEIQTQVNILQSGTFRKKGADRMNSEMVPLAPTGRDIFSRLRQRIHPATQNPMEARSTGLMVAMGSFQARPVNRTRLIELSCQSTSPDVAAGFLNAMAEEFKDDSSQSRMLTAQRTSEWLANQVEDTKAKVHDSEERLQEFILASGNVFAGQDATLDDTKLAQLKAELAKIQNERIARQTRYELTTKYPPEQLAEVLDNSVLRGYQQQIEALKRERAVLLTTFTEKHEKVRKVDAQLVPLQKAYENEVGSVIKRIRHDYEASMEQEKLLARDYSGQSQRVGSEGAKAATLNALRREVDTQRQMYQALLMQQSQASQGGSVPINPIRVVEPAEAPDVPYKPRPVLNISFGVMFGLALTVAIIFLRERLDGSIKSPGTSRLLFDAPELGVIPNLGMNGTTPKKIGWRGAKNQNGSNGDSLPAVIPVQSGHQFITESFRSTLASILRYHASGKNHKIILVTSPGPSEGKTTVVQNLGVVLAETGRRVLLVDADFRRPHLHRKFGLPNEWGLIDLLCEDLPLGEYPHEQLETQTGVPGLSILPNRVTQNNVAKALYSPRLRACLEMLSRRYDMILVDAPPILSVADARIIAPLADSVILVLRAGVTDRDSAMEAYQRIQEDGVSILGTVLTDYDLSADRRRQYYYEYGDTSRA